MRRWRRCARCTLQLLDAIQCQCRDLGSHCSLSRSLVCLRYCLVGLVLENRVQEVLEETGVPLRSMVAYLFCEVAKNFHLIHHLFPRIPFYLYPRAFRSLKPVPFSGIHEEGH